MNPNIEIKSIEQLKTFTGANPWMGEDSVHEPVRMVCPECMSPETSEGQPSNRKFFGCGSYLYGNEGKLTDQTELCQLRAEVNEWQSAFERFGVEPETAIHKVNDFEREYEGLRSRAEKMAEAWELDSTCGDIAEAMDDAVNEYRRVYPANSVMNEPSSD